MRCLSKQLVNAAFLCVLAWASTALVGAARPLHSGRGVLIVTGGNAEAYDDAVESLRAVMDREGIETRVVSLGERDSELGPALEEEATVIAVGSGALNAVLRSPFAGPVFATMILESTIRQVDASRIVGAVVLDLDYSTVLPTVKTHFPDRHRIALIQGPEMPPDRIDAIRDEAARLGFELEVVRCQSPKQLLAKLASLWGRFDFIWCFPDRSLYQGKMASTLILETLRKGIALIGYSEGMVKAGAFVGFYPDYSQIGTQTGNMVVAHMNGGPVPRIQSPREVSMGLNGRVMRVLGVKVSEFDSKRMVVLR